MFRKNSKRKDNGNKYSQDEDDNDMKIDVMDCSDTIKMETDDVEDVILADNLIINDIEMNSVNEVVNSMNGEQIVEVIEEDDSRPSVTFEFKVENISKLRDQAVSPRYMARNLPWSIMVMPRNNDRYSPTRTLGLFLQCNTEADTTAWSCYAQANICLLSQKEGIEDNKRKIQHVFYSKEYDWGFSNFMNFNDVIDPEKGYIKDDAIIIRAEVFADAPHGVCWDSKKYTGYVGLKNQGATCYMNSLLQTLFFTNKLRKAVYRMPTECDETPRSVALALQRVFHDLQHNDKPVGTKRLTKSFGWETLDSFMQHDVQEFLRVLLDKLETKMKKTKVETEIPKMFGGKMESFIKCKNVNYESRRSEAFYDIQLNIKGKASIYDSFRDYVRTEILEGENRYDAGSHGLQDAEKGVIFETFPPILHLHLMRFQYDPVTDCSIKFNDRFEFYRKIDLNEFVKTDHADYVPANYTLHAVLVHSGDNHGGHYVVFIDPLGNGQWCKFDDDVVSRCKEQDAIDSNYGGDDEAVMSKLCTNAYMLVYIRDANLDDILQPVTEKDIPDMLVNKLEEEKRIELQRRKERTESHLYMNLLVYLEESFVDHQGNDLMDMDLATPYVFRIKPKETRMEDVLQLFSESFKCSMDQLQIWPLKQRPNGTLRPALLQADDLFERYLDDLLEVTSSWRVWLQITPEIPPMNPILRSISSPENGSEDVLLFFKMFDPQEKKVYYCGHVYVNTAVKLAELEPIMNERAGFPEDTPLAIFEEVSLNRFEEILPTNRDQSLDKLNERLEDGDIFIFQKQKNILRLEDSYPEYFRDRSNKIQIHFTDRNIPNDVGFTLEFPSKTEFIDMVKELASRVGVDHDRLQLFKFSSYYSPREYQPIQYTYEGELRELLQYYSGNMMGNKKSVRKLSYQILVMPHTELEHRRIFKATFVSMNLKEEKPITLYPLKNGTVRDLLIEAKRVLEADLSPDGSGKLRLLTMASSSKISPQIPYEEGQINYLQSDKHYRIEEIPKDEVIINADEALIPVAHFERIAFSTFGIPFVVKVKQGEPYVNVKEKICQKLALTEKDLETYKFGIVQPNTNRYHTLMDDPDESVDLELFRGMQASSRPWIGLDHPNKNPKRSRFNCLEKAIKIYN